MNSIAIRQNRSTRAFLALALALSLALATQGAGQSHSSQTGAANAVASIDGALKSVRDGVVSVIVQKFSNDDPRPEQAVRRVGGKVEKLLPIVDGFSASIPASAIPSLSATLGIRSLSLDAKVRVQATTDSSALKSVYPKATNADDMWKAGYTGKGITVALIDTGIADVPDLSGRVLQVYNDITGTYSSCVNLSGESNCADSYGHGTFIAGVIAGNGASSAGAWKGVAPEANLVSIKIAGRDGSSDVSNVLSAIQWVVSFKDRYGIKVLNLSLGTDGTQSYRTDPLNYAVERAWFSGITVVVSASNRGPGPGTISKPGDDPFVITVGAVDDRGTSGLGDDQLPNFSSRGPTAADGLAKPDIAAPGAHMISLRSVGSEIDTQFPTYVDGSYRKGSGTSMSAGVVSGAVALMLQADPSMKPDRAKFALMATARKSASDNPLEVGSGTLDVYSTLQAPAGLANQQTVRSNGLGDLDLSRGTVKVATDDPLGTVVGGLLTTQLLLWDPIVYSGSSWYLTPEGSSWYGSSWYGSSWYTAPDGSSWYMQPTGSSWYGSSWYLTADGSSWYVMPDGSSWYGSSWYGSSWYGSSWYGSSWYGSSWYGKPDGSSWYGSSWYGSSWYGAWE